MNFPKCPDRVISSNVKVNLSPILRTHTDNRNDPYETSTSIFGSDWHDLAHLVLQNYTRIDTATFLKCVISDQIFQEKTHKIPMVNFSKCHSYGASSRLKMDLFPISGTHTDTQNNPCKRPILQFESMWCNLSCFALQNYAPTIKTGFLECVISGGYFPEKHPKFSAWIFQNSPEDPHVPK